MALNAANRRTPPKQQKGKFPSRNAATISPAPPASTAPAPSGKAALSMLSKFSTSAQKQQVKAKTRGKVKPVPAAE